MFALETCTPIPGVELPEGVKYSFKLEKGIFVWVKECDANKANHSCDPNCEVRPMGRLDDNGEIVGWWLGVFAIRTIQEGEEILYHYGKTSGFTNFIFTSSGCLCVCRFGVF